jgi:hypothetical protein
MEKPWYEVWWHESGSHGSYGPYTRAAEGEKQARELLRGVTWRRTAVLVKVVPSEYGRDHTTLKTFVRDPEKRVVEVWAGEYGDRYVPRRKRRR